MKKNVLKSGKKLLNLYSFIGQVAQMVEQWTENPRVGGSIPSLTTLQNPYDRFHAGF